MMRTIIAVTLALALGLSMVACGKSDEPAPPMPPVGPGAPPTTIPADKPPEGI